MKRICKLTLQIFIVTILSLKAPIALIATGSGNVFNINYPANFGAGIPSGIMFTFKSNQMITGPAYINLNRAGTSQIVKNVTLPLDVNDIWNGHFVTVIFDGSNWQMLSTNANTPPYPWSNIGNNSFNTNTGNVGINTTLPSGSFEVKESVAASGVVITTTGGSIGPRDFMIVYTPATSTTFSLPNPTTCKGRIIVIKAANSTITYTLTINAVGWCQCRWRIFLRHCGHSCQKGRYFYFRWYSLVGHRSTVKYT